MGTWPEAKLIEKKCRECGEIMWCTPTREICSTCRKKMESEAKKTRDNSKKKVTAVDFNNLPF